MLLVGYCYGIWFERRLCEEVELHLAYRWFCRLDLDDKVPARAGDGRQGRAGDVAGGLSGGAPHAAASPRGHPAVHRQPPAALEHDPEKAWPGRDPGWIPVFGKDHAPKH